MNIKTFLLMFFLSFFIFNLNFTNIGETDTIPASLLPFNILSSHGIYFDEFYKLLKNYYPNTSFFEEFNGHIISNYPLTGGFMSIPVYAPFYYLMKVNSLDSVTNFINLAFILEKLSASIMAASSVILFYFLMFLVSKSNKLSIIFALVFAFATQTFSTSSQALWQHGTANLFFIISQVYFIKGTTGDIERKNLLLALSFGILTVASRNTFFPFYLILFSLILSHVIKRKWLYIIVFMLGVAVILSYNLYFFHSLSGGYFRYTKDFDIRNIQENITGLLFSPSRGVIFYTPFYIFSFLSLFYWSKIKKDKFNQIFILNLAYFISGITLYSFWNFWWAGNSWGNRFFTDIAVPAVILSYFFYLNIKTKIAKVLLFSTIVYSIFIQLVGVFASPNSYWNVYPEHVDIRRERLWDFKDNPLTRSTAIGPDWSSGPRLLSWLKNKGARKVYEGSERKCTLRKIEEHNFLGYSTVTISFTNNSATNWITTGGIPPFKSLTLRQIFFEKSGTLLISPITPANFPIVVKSNQEIVTRIVIVPPQSNYNRLIITPAQDDRLWIDSCQLMLSNS